MFHREPSQMLLVALPSDWGLGASCHMTNLTSPLWCDFQWTRRWSGPQGQGPHKRPHARNVLQAQSIGNCTALDNQRLMPLQNIRLKLSTTNSELWLFLTSKVFIDFAGWFFRPRCFGVFSDVLLLLLLGCCFRCCAAALAAAAFVVAFAAAFVVAFAAVAAAYAAVFCVFAVVLDPFAVVLLLLSLPLSLL